MNIQIFSKDLNGYYKMNAPYHISGICKLSTIALWHHYISISEGEKNSFSEALGGFSFIGQSFVTCTHLSQLPRKVNDTIIIDVEQPRINSLVGKSPAIPEGNAPRRRVNKNQGSIFKEKEWLLISKVSATFQISVLVEPSSVIRFEEKSTLRIYYSQ